ncbi:MAG: AAA family ATPase [Sphaerochaetaceae bacterium]|jgi:GTPase SAR1 family protein
MQEMSKQLNKGQQAAADGFFKFLMDDKKELIISGPGGVGKTFLMGYLINNIIPQYQQTCQMLGIPHEYDSVVMTATTNKAAEVLSSSTKRPTETVHSFMNLKVTDNYATGEQRIEKTKAWRIHKNLIIFIDEASMIDKNLLKEIRESTLKCKIIYVGDHCQLAPVKEKLSPIYLQNLPFYELTEPMRNADSPTLQTVCQQLRETVETGVFKPIRIVPGVIDLLSLVEMQQHLDTHFLDDAHTNRIMAYTNNRVIQYNEYIRQVRGLPTEFTEGEHLINNTAIRVSGGGNSFGMLSVEAEVTLLQLDNSIEQEEIDNNVFLDVRYGLLENNLGAQFRVPIPVDYTHFRELIKYYQKAKNWNRYFYLKNTFPDLRQSDAATVYKAQGSTYDTAYIDLGDISDCRDPSQAARMLYVAFTRPRKSIRLFGNLAEKFGGLIY